MALHTPADHFITTAKVTLTEDITDEESVMQHVDAEIQKLFRDARKAGNIVVSHTVTFIAELKTIILTLHSVKA
jgi:hypothetical protein